MSNLTNNAPINTDDIEKAKKYTEALNELQKSINGLNGKLPSFADGIKAGLQGIGEKLPEVVQAMAELNKQNKELAATGGKPVNIFKQLASSMLSWNTVISIGVTLLATYGEAIIDWVSDLFKGETRLTAFGKAMKEQAIIAGSVTEARIRGAQSAQGEITALNMLFRASQNQNLSLEERRKAMVLLREQWPATFKNLDDEAFKTGKAADAYKNLKTQILDAAYAEAYKNKITANASRNIENDLKIAEERKKNLQIIASEKKAEEVKSGYLNQEGWYKPLPNDRMVMQLQDNIDIQKKLRAASDKIIYNYNTDKDILNKQNNKFADEISKLTEKPGNGVSTLTGGKQIIPDESQNNNKNKKGSKNDEVTQIAHESVVIFNEYNNQVKSINDYYDERLKSGKKLSSKQREEIEKDHQEALKKIVDTFRKDDLDKLDQFQHKLAQIVIDSTEDAKQKELLQAEENKKQKLEDFDKEQEELQQRIIEEQKQLADLQGKATTEQIQALQESIDKQNEVYKKAGDVRISYETQLNKKITEIKNGPSVTETNVKEGGEVNNATFNNSKTDETNVNPSLQQQITTLNTEYQTAITAAEKQHKDTTGIKRKYDKQKLDLETQLISSKIHAGDKYINAVLANSKKDSAIYKAAFLAKKATSIADTIISTKQAVLESLKAYSGIPFIGQALGIAQAAFMAAQGASSIATIIKQKPGFASGGQYLSDGKGAVLPGYSRTDNTNAYLRSGEAVVVSEAMRNPWARNLVSAINVAHGGRDFSVPNTSRGYAIGGIFTDGGNANRYYNQPVNDIKDMANTLAYQMINNFPPIYVDVKDVNNQQNILAQTINRVNL